MSEEQKQQVTAVVKWYKADKGFGFVRFADGSGEAFLHSRVLASLGEVSLTEGTGLVCDIAETPKGPQVVAIHSITPADPAEVKAARAPKQRRQRQTEVGDPQAVRPVQAPGPAREPKPRRAERSAPALMPVASGEMIYGTVRWYNLDSQSGLIDPWDDETGIGVYFDRAILRQSGLEVVADGEDVRFVAVSGDGGPTALRVELV
ncbi:cold-shock protein [Roseomonas genomospecies 6]|uniref:Cold shock domain-containing protein n=1 Tax=Roseomonas genomospecies 6 TaxID=214106 RepID=A0A9W7KNA5_9PROT|nr:cold shock domain-containing protein [Roseomonas genomospecies 6]KAA0676083.1 cold shock domain-containing protein [Roseomonas genomospecies 6]